MLGADVIGFHTQQFGNNFIDTIGKNVESLIDFDRFAITREEHTSYIRSFRLGLILPTNKILKIPSCWGKNIKIT